MLILVDDILKARFFFPFSKKLSISPDNDVIYITTRLTCYIYLKYTKKIENVFFIKRIVNDYDDLITPELSNTIAVLNGRQTLQDANINYREVYSSLVKTFSIEPNISQQDTLIIFGGNHVTAKATEAYFSQFGVKKLFCEISNLPEKMIFDPQGVNAQSILFKNPEILDSLDVPAEIDHQKWIEHYIDYKSKPIPQSKVNLADYAIISIDSLLCSLGFLIKEDSLSFVSKCNMLLDKFRRKVYLNFGVKADLNERYVFFPTQVRSDTQLRINSDIDNIEAIKIITEQESIPVFVKIHPAESDAELIKKYKELENEGKIKIVNNNTIELIKNSQKVYTINSTVGLESMILNKDTTVLGRAIYSNFDDKRLKQYIHSYLMDFNYFGCNVLNQSHMDKMGYLANLGLSNEI